MLAVVINQQILFDGAMTGLLYGFYAIGLILIYRASGVINFAQGAVGALGATLVATLALRYNWPYWPAVAVSLLAAVAMAGVIELVVVRRLARSPRVVVFIATVGAAELVTLVAVSLPQPKGLAQTYPSPWSAKWNLGSVTVTGAEVVSLVSVVILGALLWWFMNRSIWGLAVRGSASNPAAALLAGVNVRRVSTIAWCVGGGLAALTTIFAVPITGVPASSVATSSSTEMLVRALAIVLVARFASFGVAIGAGVILGVVERIVFYNWPSSQGLMDLILFVVVLLAVMRSTVDARSGSGSWSFSARTRPLPDHLRRHPLIKTVTYSTGALALAGAILIPLAINTDAQYFAFTNIALGAMVVLSVVVLVGWAGQLSLAQFAFAGLGAMTMSYADQHLHLQFIPAAGLSVLVCVLMALALGLPSFRLRGTQLAVVTLTFAIAAASWLYNTSFLAGSVGSAHYAPADLNLGWINLSVGRTYYLMCLLVLVVALCLAARLRRSGLGRSLVAVREDESVASAYTLSPRGMKLRAFAVAGGLAGLAGALLMPALVFTTAASFPVDKSVQAVAMAVIGGLGSVSGAVIGALWGIGLPDLFNDNNKVLLATSGFGLLLLILYFPAGLSHIGVAARDALARYLGRRIPPPDRPPNVQITWQSARQGDPTPVTERVLSGQSVSVNFGGRLVVDDASIHVSGQETIGLIGANGAGKSTLMNALGGYVPATGSVTLSGRDVSGWSPSRRAQAGLGRSFQNAALFPDLTVLETIALAHERALPTRLLPVLVGLPTWRRRNRQQLDKARELVDYLGLGRYRDHFVGTLSTGTRRICELACLLALEPMVICLDEPTAGVAQRETEALAPLITGIRRELAASMLVIEHDMPFIMAISDRVYCMESGRIIAEGSPAEVRADELVIASYLGTNQNVIARSDSVRAE